MRSTTEPGRVTDVDAALVSSWLEDEAAVLIDVREPIEHAEARIAGAVLHSLSGLDTESIRADAGSRRVVFHCQSGKRSAEAAARFAEAGAEAFQLIGGIEQWSASGRPIVRPVGGPRLPIMRQVQIVAGGLVTIGLALGVLVSPGFLGIAAFVGCGLIFAGVSGWCGMAKLLAAMPWNRVAASD